MRRDLRERIAAALRALATPATRERAAGMWRKLRSRPDAILAVVLGVGVLAMVLHWR